MYEKKIYESVPFDPWYFDPQFWVWMRGEKKHGLK